eukprot:3089819-Ditylum_brightwellii.AAC.1
MKLQTSSNKWGTMGNLARTIQTIKKSAKCSRKKRDDVQVDQQQQQQQQQQDWVEYNLTEVASRYGSKIIKDIDDK